MYSLDSFESAIREMYMQGVESDGYAVDSVEDMLDSIDFHALLQAVRHNAQTVYAYTTHSKAPKSFNYRSRELFGQRATRLYEDVDMTNQSGAIVADRTYELWLLEDMSLVAVACVSVASEREMYITQYREISGERGDPWDSGLCLNLEDLTENLLDLCKPYNECEMPVYEL